MEKVICSVCQKPKAKLDCGICHSPLCKNCAQFLAEDTFSFLKKIPEVLKQSIYCPPCFTENVEQPLAEYNATMIKAKEILIFTKSQGKETRFIKRLEDPIVLKNFPDHDELLMRMAFKAVQMDYNAIVDVDLTSEKVRTGAYQTQTWTGTGIPAFVDDNKLIKDRSFSSQPN